MENSAGRHLIMDVYFKDAEIMTQSYLTETFEELTKILDMTIIMGPEFKEVPIDPAVLEESKQTGKFMDEGGISGFVMISTSHASCHVWPLQKFASIDVFSCKEFDAVRAEAYLTERLGIVSSSTHVIDRTKPTRPGSCQIRQCSEPCGSCEAV